MKMEYSHIISFVWVRDWERAVDFYKNVLGLNKTYESEGWAEFAVPGTRGAYIALNKWAREGEAPTDTFITLGVSDLDQFRRYLLDKDVVLAGDIVTFQGERQGIRMFKFRDPDGNVLTAAETFQ